MTEITDEAPLSEQAHKLLTALILSGELKQMEVVSERQLSTKLGISRTPLREAIRRLEGERLLERQRTGALMVRALPIEEFIRILDVRKLLEGEAAWLAAGHIPASELQRLRAIAEEILSLPQDVPYAGPTTEELHELVAQRSGNPVLEELISGLRVRTSMFRFGRLPNRRHQVMGEHIRILEALHRGNAEEARNAMEDHIDQVRVTLISQLAKSRGR